MQRLEVSCAVRRLYRSLGVKGLKQTGKISCIKGSQDIEMSFSTRCMVFRNAGCHWEYRENVM